MLDRLAKYFRKHLQGRTNTYPCYSVGKQCKVIHSGTADRLHSKHTRPLVPTHFSALLVFTSWFLSQAIVSDLDHSPISIASSCWLAKLDRKSAPECKVIASIVVLDTDGIVTACDDNVVYYIINYIGRSRVLVDVPTTGKISCLGDNLGL